MILSIQKSLFALYNGFVPAGGDRSLYEHEMQEIFAEVAAYGTSSGFQSDRENLRRDNFRIARDFSYTLRTLQMGVGDGNKR
jgi:hypothetical protein